MRVLLAYDGSPHGDAAIDDLKNAGLPADAEIRVLTVADVILLPEMAAAISSRVASGDARFVHPGPIQEALGQAQTVAEQGLRRVQAAHPTGTVNVEVAGGSPSWEIVERAQRDEADLIVVGSHGRGAFMRMLLGSVSQRLVHYGPCSVRVVHKPKRARDETLRLLLALDASLAADQVVQAVASRAWPEGTAVRLVHALVPPVFPVAPPMIDVPLPDPRQVIEEGRATLERAEAALSSVGLEVTAAMEEADPKRLILSQADIWDADCIFVGARGLTRMERFLVGSVSAAVAAGAECSVEVVR